MAARVSVPARTARFALLGDERLVRLAAAGYERAFGIVYERHHQALYRYVRSILRNDVDAQDALQSTFTSAFAALGRGGPDAPIRPWLFRIAHNEAISILRRRRPTVELSDEAECDTTSVEDQVAERGRLDLLLRDLRELHDRQRSALVMRELSGLSHEEIALALETSVGAAKQAIYEARRSLFEFAEGRAMSCDEIRRTISDTDARLLRSRRVRAHLRECSGCAGFAAAISTRRQDLRALVPTIPSVAAAGLVARVAGAGSAHGAGNGVAGLTAAAASKTAGAALAANALAGVAVVATATVGVTIGVDRFAHPTPQVTVHHRGAPAARPATTLRQTPTRAVVPAGRAANRAGATASRSTSAGKLAPRPARGRREHSAAAGIGTPTAAKARAHGNGNRAAPGHSPSSSGQSTSASTRPGQSAAAPGQSTSASTSPGQSAAAPGHSTKTSSSPGHSAAAPGHDSSTSPGNSANAPGHSSSTSPGNSASAPGHSSSTSPGNSANAPGHTGKTSIVPSVPAVPDPVSGALGATKSVPPGHQK